MMSNVSQEFSPAKTLDGIETLDDDEDSDWLGEYQRGCDWEIYTTELSRYAHRLHIFGVGCACAAMIVVSVHRVPPSQRFLCWNYLHTVSSKEPLSARFQRSCTRSWESCCSPWRSRTSRKTSPGNLQFKHSLFCAILFYFGDASVQICVALFTSQIPCV